MTHSRKNIQISNVSDRFDSGLGLWLQGWHEQTPSGSVQCHSRAGVLWRKIVARCKPCGFYQANTPSYVGTINGFTDFQHFAEWVNSAPGYDCIDDRGNRWHLDKDILSFGANKAYSPDRCCFVPACINILLITRASDRGSSPLGVHFETRSQKFKAQCSIRGKEKSLGLFSDPAVAHSAWQAAKAKYIREMAHWYSCQKGSTPKVAEALCRRAYQIEKDLHLGLETTSL